MNIRVPLTIAFAATLMAGCAATSTKLTTDKQRISYVVGYQIGQNLKQQHMEIDPQAFSQAVADVLGGSPAKMSDTEMRQAILAYQQKRAAEGTAMADKNLKAGQAFLAQNKTRPGVVTLPSGLQYKIITAGHGRKPKLTDTVVANYRGTLVDGTEFDSSYKRGVPATFPLQNVIKGWQEALQLMPAGSKWEVYIPSDLAYGPNGAGSAVGPNETLIFDIELLKIK